jgi:hypothetical protein
MVIAETPELPAVIVEGERAPAETVKSKTWTTEPAPWWEPVPGRLLPLIVTRKVPAVSALSVQYVEDEEFAARTTAGQVTVNPVAGLASGVRTTVPAKSSVLVRLTGIFALGSPRLKLTGPPVEIVKSPTWTTVLAEWRETPVVAVPAIVTEYVPGLTEVMLHEVVTTEFAVRLAEGQVIVNPVGELVDDRETVPSKLLMLVRETDIEPSPPELISAGVTLIAKSPTCIVDNASCEAVPGAPVPVNVIW